MTTTTDTSDLVERLEYEAAYANGADTRVLFQRAVNAIEKQSAELAVLCAQFEAAKANERKFFHIQQIIPASLIFDTNGDVVEAVKSTFAAYVRVAAELTLLRSQLAEMREAGWRDIATAPKEAGARIRLLVEYEAELEERIPALLSGGWTKVSSYKPLGWLPTSPTSTAEG